MANNAIFALMWTLFCIGNIAMEADIEYMRRTITNHFSVVRNHFVNPIDKDAASTYIHEEFVRFDLDTEYNHFEYNDVQRNLKGTFGNVVGVLPGTRFGTASDRIIGVGAHYDTVVASKGVDDNGSGVAAMLEAARQLTSKKVSRKNTIIFISFDLEEYGLIGSAEFIRTWLNPWLVRNYGEAAQSLRPYGVIILDTVMEYNTSRDSQDLPDDQVMQQLFPGAFRNIQSDGYQGDFLTLIYRGPSGDADLADKFADSWKLSDRSEFELEKLSLPTADISALIATAGQAVSNLLRSDHQMFWKDNIPAVFLTDSANFRGDMKLCYHQACDDLETMLTDDNLDFLAKTTDTIVRTVNDLSEPDKDDSSGAMKTTESWCLVAMVTFVVGFLSMN